MTEPRQRPHAHEAGLPNADLAEKQYFHELRCVEMASDRILAMAAQYRTGSQF